MACTVFSVCLRRSCHFRVKHSNSKLIVSVFSTKVPLSKYCSIWASLDLEKRPAECDK